MAEIDPKRLKRQKEAVNNWKENNYTGTFEWATGTGKTYTAFLAIEEIRKERDVSVMVVVPTDYLRNQWRKQIEELQVSNIEVNTVHSWLKREAQADLLILDEVHSYTGGQVFSQIFEIPYTYILGLTAQQREDPVEQAFLIKKAPIVDRLNLKEALEKEYVSPFTIYNVGLQLDSHSRALYDDLHTSFMKYFSTFFFNLGTLIKALNNEKQRKNIAKVYNITEQQVYIRAIQANRLLQKRKEFLYNSEEIFKNTVELINRYPNKKILSFSEVTKFADSLYDATSHCSGVYHSSLPSSITVNDTLYALHQENNLYRVVSADAHLKGEMVTLDEVKQTFKKAKVKRIGREATKKYYLNRFLSGDVNVLHTARALNVGVNIPNVDLSILCSFNSSTIDSIQRTGRAIRKQDGKKAVEVNFYILKSQSEKWLIKKQAQTPNVKWVKSIDEIEM